MPTPIPETDWLDDAISWALSVLGGGSAWTLDQAGRAAAALLGFTQHHWLMLTALAAMGLFGRRFLEWQAVYRVIAEQTLKTRFGQAHANYHQRQMHAAEERERAWMVGADEDDFRARIDRLARKIKRHEDIRDLLREKMRGSVGQESALGAGVAKHKREADQLKLEVIRLELLWAKQRVLNLVDRLVHGNDADARTALAQLNAIWRNIDYRLFIPYETLNATDQKRILQLFGMMSSSAHVGEARNAFSMMQKLLDSYQYNWGQAA